MEHENLVPLPLHHPCGRAGCINSTLNLQPARAQSLLADNFNLGAGGSVYSLAVQADGKILADGSSTTLGGQPRRGLGRLNPDGTLDSSFNPGADHYADSLALQADGKILAGGYLTNLAGQPRSRIGRLHNTAPATQHLRYDGSTLTWLRGGTSPEVWRTTFEASTHRQTWTPLGAGQRIPGGWQLTDVLLATNATIRARGFVASGGKSDAIMETILELGPLSPPVILTSVGGFGVRSNQFGFTFSGAPGLVVVVEGSTNLQHWFLLQTNLLGDPPLYFADPKGSGLRQRFYRVRLGP